MKATEILKRKYSPNALRLAGILKDDVFVGPKSVMIHINSDCNLRCLYCWYHSAFSKKEYSLHYEMNFEIFKKLINDCSDMRVTSITISGRGEPFLHSRISDMINYIKQKNIFLTVLTNGTFDIQKIKNIYKIDEFFINFSAPTEKLYNEIHQPRFDGAYKKVIKNLLYLSKLKKKNILFPKVNLVYILNEKNYKYIEKVMKLCSDLKLNRIEFKIMDTTPNNKRIILKNDSIENLKKLIRKIEFKKYRIKHNLNFIYNVFSDEAFVKHEQEREFCSIESVNARHCYYSWYNAFIDLSGNVTPCCLNHRAIMGNIYQKSFKEIWFSEEAKKIRSEAKNNLDLNKYMWQPCRFCFSNNKKNMRIHKKIIKLIRRLQ